MAFVLPYSLSGESESMAVPPSEEGCSSPCCLPGKVDSAPRMASDTSASAVLLGRGHSEPTGKVKVKNTFIDIEVREEDDEDGDGLPMVGVKTCPTLQGSRRSPTGCASWPLTVSALASLREDRPTDVMYVQPSRALTLQVQQQRSASFRSDSSLTPGSSSFENPAVKVKNTFIEVSDDSDDEDGMPMVATRSCPAPQFRRLKSPTGAGIGFGMVSVQEDSSTSSPTSSVAYVQPSPALTMQSQRSAPTPETLLANAVAAHEQPSLGCGASPSCAKADSAPQVRVRNTFIECVDSDDEEGGMPMVAVKSCPVAGPALARIGEVAAVETASVMYVQPVAALAAQPQKVPRAPASPDILPLEIRQPQMSLGSVEHEEGSCRPCAWFWRPQGCTNGRDCRHCHLCPMGEVKTRRKSKLASLKAKAREEAQEEATPTGQASAEAAAACPLQLSALV